LAEVRPETLARDLGEMCRRQPQRFAQLAARMPIDMNSHYLNAILFALAEPQRPENLPESAEWKPASVQQVEAVFERFASRLEERECSMRFCWIIQKRPNEAWSRETLQRLAHFAIHHPHPSENEYTVHRGGALTDEKREADIVGTALNCVRGQAASAIADVLYFRLDEVAFFSHAMASLVADKHPAVRAAAIELALPLLNGDRAVAVESFLQACDCPEDQVLKIHHVDRFLSYAILHYLDQLQPLLVRMIQSSLDEIASKGATWITVVWAHTRKLGDLLNACLLGSVAHRKGVAETLVNQMIAGHGDDGIAEKLSRLLDDADKEVRQKAASGFHNSEVLREKRGVQLVSSFAKSQALPHAFDLLFMGLKDFPHPLLPYADAIFLILDRVVPDGGADDVELRWLARGAEHMAEVLLRLYQQADNNPTLRKRCLDGFDRLLAQQIGIDLLQQLDS